MLVVMKHNASSQEIRDVVEMVQELGYEARPIPGRQRTSVGLIGNDGQVEPNLFQSLPGVWRSFPLATPTNRCPGSGKRRTPS
jgi:3-deoxy-7-phosphoheptulonate synthase